MSASRRVASRRHEAEERLRAAVGPHEFGVLMHGQRLRREHPDWTVRDDPGAEALTSTLMRGGWTAGAVLEELGRRRAPETTED